MPPPNTYRVGPVTVAWSPRSRTRARRLSIAAAAVAAGLAIALLRTNIPAPGPTAEERRLIAGAAAGADPNGLGRLTLDQMDRIARGICAALDRDPTPGRLPLLSDLLAGEPGTGELYANSRRIAAGIATAVYCPRFADLIRGAIADT